MKLFRIEVTTKRFRVLDVVVYAASIEEAKLHLTSKFNGCQFGKPRELSGPKHFVVAEPEVHIPIRGDSG